MRKLVLLLALTSALVFVGAALAVETYGGPRYWNPGDSAASSWQSGWTRNAFNKATSGYETTVTFIDNVSYGLEIRGDGRHEQRGCSDLR